MNNHTSRMQASTIFALLLLATITLAGCQFPLQPSAPSTEATADTSEMTADTPTDTPEEAPADSSEATTDTSEAATDTSEAAPPSMPEATMTKLADGVYHYFVFFYSSLVVVTDEGVLITDPSNSARGQLLKAAIAELTDQPVTHIVLTHEHYDHTGGTEIFPDAQVICHAICADVFQLDEYGLVPDEVDITFESYLPIELGDMMVELHHLGPGDGMATTIIYMPEEQVVMSADLYEPRAITSALFMDDKNPLGVRKILNEVASWDLKHAINAHSPGTDPQDLREAAVYYEDLYQAVNAVLQPIIEQSGPGAAFGVLGTLHEQISLPQYEEWGEYDSSFAKHVFRMAMGILHGG